MKDQTKELIETLRERKSCTDKGRAVYLEVSECELILSALSQGPEKNKELKKMTLDEIEKEAFVFIGNNDEYAEIIPDGNIDAAAKFVAEFIYHLWEIDAIYKPLP